jgi:hypothetical protein
MEDWISARRPGNTKPGPNAAAFRVIMISEKRYKPMVSPIVTCIPITHISQTARVLFGQMNNGYPVSKRQTAMPRNGKRYLHETRICGEIRSYGGEVITRQMLVPFHHSTPAHLVMPPKK